MRLDAKTLVRTALLIAITLVIQTMRMPQWVTGPAVNAILYVAAIHTGYLSGASIGLITPWIALLVGIIKLPPLVPVIMAGNVSLALVSGLLGRRHPYIGMGIAALVKFLVMTLGIKLLISGGTKIPAVVYTGMTVTQLFTALGGAVLAALVLEALRRLQSGGISS